MHAVTMVIGCFSDAGFMSFLRSGELTLDAANDALKLFHGMEGSTQASHPTGQMRSLLGKAGTKPFLLMLINRSALSGANQTASWCGHRLCPLDQLNLDAAVRQCLFGDPKAVLASLQCCLLDSVTLEKPIQVLLVSPEGPNIRRAN
jgi:hypothetical protein